MERGKWRKGVETEGKGLGLEWWEGSGLVSGERGEGSRLVSSNLVDTDIIITRAYIITK